MVNFHHAQVQEDVDTICASIRKLVGDAQRNAAIAMEEMKALRDEKWKDKELESMSERLSQALSDCYRGFPISESEEISIQIWKDQHYTNQHGADTPDKRIRMQGVSGGLFSYIFLPTSIGVSGVCRCNSCYRKALKEVGDIENREELKKAKEKYDAEFEFQRLG